MRGSSLQSTSIAIDREIDSDFDDVQAVANNITDVITVATDIQSVIDVAPYAADLGDVIAISDDIAILGPISTDIELVADHIDGTVSTDITVVATDLSLLNSTIENVSANMTNVTSVATDLDLLTESSINKVSAIDTEVAVVAGISANVTAVAVNDANITTVATLNGDVTKVANIDADVSVVAANDGNITTVAANDIDISTVADNIDGTISTDVTIVANSMPNVNIVSANLTDVTNFADVWYGPLASDPTLRNDGSAMVNGDMYFNTTDDRTYTYTGSAWAIDPVTTDDVIMPNIVGSPTHIDTFAEVYNHMYSSGIMSGCDLTDVGDGTITIASGSATIRATGDLGHGALYSAEVPLASAIDLPLVDNSANYVYIIYDGITLSWGVSQVPATVNMLDVVPAYIIVREGIKLTVMDVRSQNVDHIGKNQVKEFYTQPFTRKSGGCAVSDAGTLHLACTAGAFYFQLDEHAVPALDTTGADTFEYYKHVAGVWTETDSQIIDSLNYDDGTDLVALGNNKYSVHWIYTVVGITSYYAVLYGTQEYSSVAAAQAATTPSSLPPSVGNLGVLLGRVIVEKGATELYEVASSFTQAFTATVATDHEGLAGLQGGAVGDHVHLTTAEKAGYDASKVIADKIDNTAVTSITFNADGTMTVVIP